MTSITKKAPQWATRSDCLQGAENDPERFWHERDLLTVLDSLDTISNLGPANPDDGQPSFVLVQDGEADGGGTRVVDSVGGLEFTDVADMRRYARALLAAADEAEAILGEAR